MYLPHCIRVQMLMTSRYFGTFRTIYFRSEKYEFYFQVTASKLLTLVDNSQILLACMPTKFGSTAILRNLHLPTFGRHNNGHALSFVFYTRSVSRCFEFWYRRWFLHFTMYFTCCWFLTFSFVLMWTWRDHWKDTADLISVIESHGPSPDMHAHDTQVSGSCHPAAVDDFSSMISDCVGDVSSWMKSNRLSLNCNKTVWCTSSRRQHQIPNSALSTDGTLVEPVKSARDLGMYIDSDLLMRTHVQHTVLRCFAVLRQLQQIRCSMLTDTFQMLVVSLVLTCLDYGNSVLAGLPVYLVRRLQSVLKAAAWLPYHLRRSDHITDALVCLHWLCVLERFITRLTFWCTRSYTWLVPQYHSNLPGHQPLQSAATNCLAVPLVKLTRALVKSRSADIASGLGLGLALWLGLGLEIGLRGGLN